MGLMAIPPLLSNGVLPPGEYPATVDEILAAFPSISVERNELNQALQDAIPAFAKLKTIAPDMILYIDGSFLTSKPSPVDVDILVLTDVLDEVQVQDFLNQECPIPATYFDVHADPLNRRYLVNVFTRTRSNQPKGIVVLAL
jgi:hypothetical protein